MFVTFSRHLFPEYPAPLCFLVALFSILVVSFWFVEQVYDAIRLVAEM
jgi:hypothetical protein